MDIKLIEKLINGDKITDILKENESVIITEKSEPSPEVVAGLKIEKEHEGTFNWLVKKIKEIKDDSELEAIKDEYIEKIVNDHLKEFSTYYTDSDGLLEMEKKLKDKMKKEDDKEKETSEKSE